MAKLSSSNGIEKFPKLRFPEFKEPWKQVRLSDFAQRVVRKNKNNETDLPLTISSKDGLVDQISFFNKTIASKDISNYYLIRNGEFAYNKSYSVGYDFGSIKRLERYPMGALSTLYICFTLTKHNSDYIKTYFDSLKWYKEIYMISAEGARNHGLLNVPTDDFFDTYHYITDNPDEQQKIAAFINLIDQRIQKQQQLLENIKKYKRGALSALFPKKGEITPQYRFAGFTEPWKQRKAKDLCSISTGKSNTQDRVNDGIYPFYVRSPIVEHSNRYLFDEEAVLTVGDGVGTGKVFHYVNGKYDLHQRVYRMFDFSEEITAKYFYYYFSNHFYDRVMAMTAKTSVDSVRYEMIADMDIVLPKVKEQMAISACFDRLDNLITLHQHKYDTLLFLKNAILQQMFI